MIVLNFLPIASGGGLQNSLSFLATLDTSNSDYFALCRSDSQIENLCVERSIAHKSVKSRVQFELFGARKLFPKGTTCFTIFGPPLLSTSGYWLNICGVAYSNLFYPNTECGSSQSGSAKSFQRFKNRLRKSALKHADAWVFETGVMAECARRDGFPSNRVFHVATAVSDLVLKSRNSPIEYCRDHQRKLIAYVSDARPNKRQHLLLDIADALEQIAPGKYRFVTTMDENQDYARRVLSESRRRDLSEAIRNIGPVKPEKVGSLISSVDAMCLFSVLESFSCNCLEAWTLRKPLFVTDARWSRESCRDGAIYVDPTSARETASEIDSVLTNSDKIKQVVAAGEETLAAYPTPSEKTKNYLSVIKMAEELGRCSRHEKRSIWYPDHEKLNEPANRRDAVEPRRNC